ncbi:hypothetical protein IV102_06320 [bacterium]|nr:hypothetical protein [bacterium]
MRKGAVLMGLWCGCLQLSLIYSLSFLWSATPRAGLWVLLAWLSGSALGVQSGEFGLSRLRWGAAWLVGFCAIQSGSSNLLWSMLIVSSFLGGVLGGHWFVTIETQFVNMLRWEALGMSLGTLLSSALVYQGLVALWCNCAMVTVMMIWKERAWCSNPETLSP